MVGYELLILVGRFVFSAALVCVALAGVGWLIRQLTRG